MGNKTWHAGPNMGAPKQPTSDGKLHGHLGAHAGSFPTGYIRSDANLASKERATQGNVGFDVAKGTKAGY